MRSYKTKIPTQPRAYLAHEHPTWHDHLKSFGQRLKYLPYYRLIPPVLLSKPKVWSTEELLQLFATELEQVQLDNATGNRTKATLLWQHSHSLVVSILDAFCYDYLTCDSTRAFYPGYHAEQGVSSDSIEGVTRIIPLLAAYLKHYYQTAHLSTTQLLARGIDPNDLRTSIASQRITKYRLTLEQIFTNALNPEHFGYWGDLESYSQLICEASDVAIALWISKDFIYKQLAPAVQQQILTWLSKAHEVDHVDNNWHLFTLTAQFVKADLEQEIATRPGYDTTQVTAKETSESSATTETAAVTATAETTETTSVTAFATTDAATAETSAESNKDNQVDLTSNPNTAGYLANAPFYQEFVNLSKYHRLKEFYTNDGWFRDGANGDYDYYNSWGFYYGLYWLHQIDPQFDGEFIKQASAKFADKFQYLFAPQGFAFFGRSLPYRLGATTGLFVADLLNNQNTGSYVKTLISNNNYFLNNEAFQAGYFSSGLFATDRRLQDPYSGPASPFWSLRPYILLFNQGFEANYWQTLCQPLPIEQQSYQVSIPAIGLEITGNHLNQEVVARFIESKYPYHPQTSVLIDQGIIPCFCEWLLGRSTRPKNNLLRKGVTTYSSQFNLYLTDQKLTLGKRLRRFVLSRYFMRKIF